MNVSFQKGVYEVIFTDHAIIQMELRNLNESDIIKVIESGEVKAKEIKNKFWVYKKLRGRVDNMIAVSISIEKPHLIVITTMINWRPL